MHRHMKSEFNQSAHRRVLQFASIYSVCLTKNIKCSGIESLTLLDSSQMSKYEVTKLHCICQFCQELLPLKGHSDDLQRKGSNVALPYTGLRL